MDRYKVGIDFVIVTVGERGAMYTEWCVRSIEKYVKNVDNDVYVVANYEKDWKKERDILKDTLDKYNNINLIKGYSEEYTLEPSEAGGYENTGRRIYSKLDNAPMSYGCYCHSKGMEVGIKSGDRKYVCILDNDSIFLNEWFPVILEKEYAEKYFFISNRYDPGNLFEIKTDEGDWYTDPMGGVCRPQFLFTKRQNFEDNDLYPNTEYRDTAGNLTLFVQENEKSVYVMVNSYQDHYEWQQEVTKDLRFNDQLLRRPHLKKQHLIDVPWGEQAWLEDVPIHFHHAKGTMRDKKRFDIWEKEVEKYLNG